MRRALFVVLVAIPGLAAAQSSAPGVGTIDRLPGLMNLAQCAGTTEAPNRVPRLDDEANLRLTWQVKLDASMNGQFTPTTGTFKVYASTTAFQASNSTAPWSCRANSSGAAFNPAQIGLTAGYEAPAQTMSTAREISFRSIATALSLTCAPADTTTPINLCVEWLPDGTTAKGWAVGTINYDPTVPDASSFSTLTPGDGKLRVEGCSEGDDATSFIARAVNGTEVRWSSQASSCNGLVVTGLTNEQPYDVTVFGMNAANNPSAPSAPVQGTPIPTDDFWDEYHEQPGAREQGGCNTSAGAAGILAALSLIAAAAAARRRKS